MQPNLLCSGSTGAEVISLFPVPHLFQLFIWDVKDLDNITAYGLGEPCRQQGDISHIAWNCKVAHIIGASSTNGVTAVYDLKVRFAGVDFNEWKLQELLTIDEEKNLTIAKTSNTALYMCICMEF